MDSSSTSDPGKTGTPPLEDCGGARLGRNLHHMYGIAKMGRLVFRDMRIRECRYPASAEATKTAFACHTQHSLLFACRGQGLPLPSLSDLIMQCSRAPSSSTAIFLLLLTVACRCMTLACLPDRQQTSSQRDDEYPTSSAHSAHPVYRLAPRISDLTLIHFDHTSSLSHTQFAVQILAHFYTEISRGAEGPWKFHTPRAWIRVTFGSLQLLMSATEGHTVPWNFVKWHALEMLGYAQRGYVGTYDAYYVTPHGEAGVIVSLTCQAIGALNSAAAIAAAAADGYSHQPLNPIAKPFNPP